jgi:transcriptional regulator with XRE-family HTH domain
MTIRLKRNMMEHMAMDSPLRRWRRSQGLKQRELDARLGVPKGSIARWEQLLRVPSLDYLEKIADETGLAMEAILYPQRYLREHPDFLATWAEQPPRRGRRKRPRPPEEGASDASR